MKFPLLTKSVSLGCLITALLPMLSPAKAQQPITYGFTGQIASVNDPRNLFNGIYTVGAPVSGSYTFFDSGYHAFGDNSVMAYEFYGFPNSFGAPILSPEIRVNADGHVITGRLNDFAFFVQVANDYPSVGDDYFLGSPLKYPSFFNDQGGDPIFDDMGLELTDPTGTALNSTDLPLTNLDLNAFATNTGFVEIIDPITFSQAAFMQYNINTLQAVPEPGSVALLLGISVSGGVFAIRRRCVRR